MKSCILLFVSVLALAAEPPAAVRLFDAKLHPTQRANACFELRGKADLDTVGALGRAMEDPELLACAAENLRLAGAIDALKQALASPSAEVRAAAARVLGSFQKPELLASLNQAAQDENALVSTNALAGLSQYRDAAVVPYLAALSRKGGMTGDMALDRLAQIDPGAALQVARELLASSQIPDQLYGIRVIGATGNSSDLPALQKIFAGSRESLAQRGRGFGLMPPINLSRAAEGAIAAIKERGK
ncbi:MAG: HEAT repeat domain-containing protein [Acidobacteriia bacterium]|nr:HEAT repeat domain-containing protein [Terriglobia bacterium]